MPTYDYVCSKCGHDFQRVERISEHMKVRPRCPKCKSTRVDSGYKRVRQREGIS